MGTMYEVDQSTGAVGDPVIGDGPIIGGNVVITKLWENPDPTQSFAAQNVEIQGLSSYDLIKIVGHLSNSGTFEKTICESEMPYGEGNNVITGSYTSNRYRIVTISGNNLQFAAGNAGGNTDNTAIIPYQIYGIKLKEV